MLDTFRRLLNEFSTKKVDDVGKLADGVAVAEFFTTFGIPTLEAALDILFKDGKKPFSQASGIFSAFIVIYPLFTH